MSLTNAPNEGLPPGCTCVLMAPGTSYEALALNPACRVHNPDSHRRGRGMKFHGGTKRRNGY